MQELASGNQWCRSNQDTNKQNGPVSWDRFKELGFEELSETADLGLRDCTWLGDPADMERVNSIESLFSGTPFLASESDSEIETFSSTEGGRLKVMKSALAGVILVLMLSLVGCLGNSNEVTRSEYQEVETGMSYSTVENIVGESGEKVSSSEVDGFGGSGVSTNLYRWQNSDGTNMVVIFQNNEVISKSQFGLSE